MDCKRCNDMLIDAVEVKRGLCIPCWMDKNNIDVIDDEDFTVEDYIHGKIQ